MIVMKFGGSSVGSPEAVTAAARLVAADRDRNPVVVVSALHGVTDYIVRAVQAAERNDRLATDDALSEIVSRHRAMSVAFGPVPETERLLGHLAEGLEAVRTSGHASDAVWADILSCGERMSVHDVAAAFVALGVDAEPVDARTCLRLSGRFQDGDVDFIVSHSLLRARLADGERNKVRVVTGFIGSDAEGRTMLLGRGGSDYTASILGEALEAEEIVICKEVDGILSADPRVVPEAGCFSRVSYDEAAEMSYFGAKVLHPKTMIPAARAGIPIRIRNTFTPEAPGTLISHETDDTVSGVKTVSAHHGLTMLTLEGKGMAGIAGFAARLFAVAGELGVNIVMFTQASSEQAICIVVTEEDGRRLEEAISETYGEEIASMTIDRVRVSRQVSAVAVVGDGMRGRHGIAGRVFSAVADAGVNVLAIAQGSSERNISFIVASQDADEAVRGIHARLDLRIKVASRETSYV